MVLLEANERRALFLERAVVTCGLQRQVTVVHQRAEIAGRDPLYRATFDVVVVRSFGTPAVVAECAAPLLRVGGWLIVSEPPSEGVEEPFDPSRWPVEPLEPLGLTPVESVRTEFGYQILHQIHACPDRFPRRNGVPSKKPLF
jgi:16S rRNA (guanine527-N7)-methyltransferase